MASLKSSQGGNRHQPRLRDRQASIQRRKRLFVVFWIVVWLALLHLGITAEFWRVRSFSARSSDPAIKQWAHTQLRQAAGEHLLTIDPPRWQARLEANPLVKRAEVRRWLWPARLEALVTVRKPWLQAVWGSDTTGTAGVIDRDGHVLPLPIKTKTETGLQFQTPPPQGNRMPLEVLRNLALLAAYNESEGLPKPGTFDVSDAKNVKWRSGPITVWLGDLGENPEQMKVKLGGILPLLMPLAKEKGPKLQYVDLRDWQNPVLKMQ